MDPRLHKKLTQDGKLGGPTLPTMGAGSGLGHVDRRPPSMPTPMQETAQPPPITNSGLGMTNPTVTPQITPPSTFTPGGVLPHVSMALSGPATPRMGGTLKKAGWFALIIGTGAAVFFGARRLAGPRLMSKLSDDYMPELDDDDYED